jgi:hypothetical protein
MTRVHEAARLRTALTFQVSHHAIPTPFPCTTTRAALPTQASTTQLACITAPCQTRANPRVRPPAR